MLLRERKREREERGTERDAPIPRLVALNQPRKRRSMRSSGDLGGVGSEGDGTVDGREGGGDEGE